MSQLGEEFESVHVIVNGHGDAQQGRFASSEVAPKTNDSSTNRQLLDVEEEYGANRSEQIFHFLTFV